MSANTISITAVANVARIPRATAAGGAVLMSTVADANANTDTAVLTLPDGTRDRPALLSQLAESDALQGETSAADSEPLERRLNTALAALAEAALLRG